MSENTSGAVASNAAVRPIYYTNPHYLRVRQLGGSITAFDERDEVFSAPLYDQAALDAAVAAERERAARWIPVTERLPEKNTEVLIAFAGQCSIPATGQYTGSAFDSHGWCYPAENRGTANDGEDPVVTHWMTLPEVPNSN